MQAMLISSRHVKVRCTGACHAWYAQLPYTYICTAQQQQPSLVQRMAPFEFATCLTLCCKLQQLLSTVWNLPAAAYAGFWVKLTALLLLLLLRGC
jgi:hypothetical protein